ncbi:hypothetical protein BBP40_012761 [Aspergillus hancockii]|nr:hypothetical protein BBP40_012761 [Aspergillus hancockii]
MAYDCYCAICGANFSGTRVGSQTPDALRRRDRFVERRRQAVQAGQDIDSLSTDDESESEDDEERMSSANSNNLNETEHGAQEDGDGEQADEDEYDENLDDLRTSYDPRLVREDDLVWLETVYCLGFNSRALGTRKAFVSGPGVYEDYGQVDVQVGTDPLHPPNQNRFTCYNEDNGEEESSGPVIPFHFECFQILSTALTGSTKSDRIDNDVLYSVMLELCGKHCVSLYLYYGDEYCVTNPSVGDDIAEFILLGAKNHNYSIPSPDKDLGSCVLNDPFGSLPVELVQGICSYLSWGSMKSLLRASFATSIATQQNFFWRRFIRLEMPWFQEIHSLIKYNKLPADLNYKGFFLWLDMMSTPKYGKTDRFMAITNRRRIWTTCQQLEELYHNALARNHGEAMDEHARIPIGKTQTQKMFLVGRTALPQETNLSTLTKQWALCYNDIKERPAIFEAFFNAAGEMVGMSIVFGAQRRVFGYSTDDATFEGEIQCFASTIIGHDWIKGLILHISGQEQSPTTNRPAIRGVTVLLKSGKEFTLGVAHGYLNKRPLIVSEGNVLVGLVGHIGKENGPILRLRLLEYDLSTEGSEAVRDAAYLESGQLQPAELPFARRVLWSSEAMNVNVYGAGRAGCPIWFHPSIRVLPLMETDDGLDLDPWQILHWAHDAGEIRRLKKISAIVFPDTTVDIIDDNLFFNVHGLTVEFIRRYWEPPRHAGLSRDSTMVDDPKDLNYYRHFEIDGPGGEYITKVGLSVSRRWSAIKLRTNRDREVVFGQEDASHWNFIEAPAGEVIVGLALNFPS